MRCNRPSLLKYSIIHHFTITTKPVNPWLRFISAMCNKEFMCWDNGIDLDEHLREYTDHDEISGVQLPKEEHHCPDCKKILKSISGFRGPSGIRKVKQKVLSPNLKKRFLLG